MNGLPQDIISEFVVESHENLSRLDQELVELEKNPVDGQLLASIFRTIHTIKGTCGFLAFSTLEKITHHAESLLSQLRGGQRDLTPALVSLILETVDATRKVLASIESDGTEGSEQFEELTGRLRDAARTNLGMGPGGEVRPDDASERSAGSPQAEAGALPGNPRAPLDQEGDWLRAAAVDEFVNSLAPRSGAGALTGENVRPSAVADANIRVGVVLLDRLMDLVGELVLTRNQVLQFNAGCEDAALNATSQRLNLITTELQQEVMKTRMQPIGTVWNTLPRVVRDMAVTLGKQIRLELEGEETELDRTIIEAIKDPLVHLVRNCCDHGIEAPEIRIRAGKPPEGKLTLRAYYEGGQVNIEIGDDGAGVDVARVRRKAVEKGLLRPEEADKLSDRAAVNLIFQPGFSTAPTITKLSGRGVGMDVVKSHIEKIGGIVDVFNRFGEGVTVKLKIPLTLAIIPGLVISSGGERFVIPQVSLLELIRLERDSAEKQIEHVNGTPVYRRRGSLLPVAYLNRVLGLQSAERDDAVSMVVLQAEDRQFGLVVDRINDTQEIVVKPVGKQLKGLAMYAGATIMGDGHVALILDVLGIGLCSGVLSESREPVHGMVEPKTQTAAELQRLLLFRAGSFARLAVPLSLVARLEEFPRRSIERAGGRQVVQYRDRILPLVWLETVLESGTPERDAADPLQVIVFTDGDHSLGIVVDQILDVVEDSVAMRQRAAHKGLLGSAVVGSHVADFLDLQHVIRAAACDWFEGAGAPAEDTRVLVAEASPFSRGLIRSGLDMAGYRVFEALDLDDAIRRLEQHSMNLVIASLDLPPHGGSALLAAMRRRRDWDTIPVLGLADSREQVLSQPAGLGDCQLHSDREAMLESVARLSAALVSTKPSPVTTGDERRR